MLVGGGNSAGQAAVFLAGHARKIYMIIRGGGLGASMSRYLIERIEATPNIELLFNTEVVALEGGEDGLLARVRWRSRLGGEASSTNIRNVFFFANQAVEDRELKSYTGDERDRRMALYRSVVRLRCVQYSMDITMWLGFVGGALSARIGFHMMFAEINVSGQLAHKIDVNVVRPVGPQRR